MEAVPAVSSGAEKPPQFFLISLAPRLNTIRHADKCSKLENDAICGLTTFSIANDVAKYFAIIPALFAGTLPWLKTIDIMHLHSPTSAILSAVIFNALIIPALIPVALKGVSYQPLGADALLRKNLLVWGLGGVILPFLGIKLIDVIMVAFHLVA